MQNGLNSVGKGSYIAAQVGWLECKSHHVALLHPLKKHLDQYFCHVALFAVEMSRASHTSNSKAGLDASFLCSV